QIIYFFFSNRRRHTIFSRDWSSDVCSSDLYGRKTKGFRIVKTTDQSVSVGDEPLQIKRKFPETEVIVCEDRVLAIKQLRDTVDRSEERRVGKESSERRRQSQHKQHDIEK